MVGEFLGAAFLWLILIVIAIVVLVYVLRWLYRRSTKDTAFIRTGFLGEKVVVNGGAFVIPVLHEITPVNMNVMRIDVTRRHEQALITRNRIRVDVEAEFFVRVGTGTAAVSAAAQTLGRRTLQEDGLRGLVEGKFAGAMRTVAARMTLEEMHEQRGEFASAVRSLAAESLAPNGLELETVAIVDLDQTGLEFFDPANAFDAEGLTRITEEIEARRRTRNEIEQRTLVEIRNQNLDAQKRVYEIDRDQEYARLAQERELEIRRAEQRTDLARERATHDRQAEEAQLTAREAVEKARLAQELAITGERIRTDEERQRLEVARRRAIDAVELQAREKTEREQIQLELELEKARIQRELERRELEIAREQAVEIYALERQVAVAEKAIDLNRAEAEKERSLIAEAQRTETDRIAKDQALDGVRIEREKLLDGLQIAKRQAFEEAELALQEDVERARLATERAIAEARILNDRLIRSAGIDRDKQVELAEVDKAIEIARKSQERSAALAAASAVRAKAVEAEEQALTVREKEIAERRKLTDLIAVGRDTEAEALRVTSKAEAEMRAAKSLGEARKIAALAQAEAEKVVAVAAAERYKVDAEGQRALNESENALSEPARQARIREKLLDHLEGIVRESVKPMERIEAIKILHVDGLGGSGDAGRKNVTDEVIDSALRYRVQAPMIDNLMKEIGIEGGSMGRMTDVLRDAKDMAALVQRAEGTARGKPADPAATSDDRDR
ncbi:MAG: flotillin domain-containing protein [Ancalomicrobiaceae bacterium]|nr:flotillin domain-containing protein [Ancalomicrobiaceae bacterium]